MNLLSKFFSVCIMLSVLHLSGCRPDSLLPEVKCVQIVEKGFSLNSLVFFDAFRILDDSFALYKSGDESLFKFNLHTGALVNTLTLPDSIRNYVLKKTKELFHKENIIADQDSLFKQQNEGIPLTRKLNYCFQNDTLHLIALYRVSMYNEFELKGKNMKGIVNDSYPVLIKANKNLKLIDYSFIMGSKKDESEIDIALPFTYMQKNYYFPDLMTFIMKSPGGKQLRVYQEKNGVFYIHKKQDKSLPLSDPLVKRMGYADTTVRNIGGVLPANVNDFAYTMRTINNIPYFCNKFQLIDLISNKEIFDGIKNNFTILGYTVDAASNYFILAQGDDLNKYSLKVFDKNVRPVKEQDLIFEKNEKVICADMKNNTLVFIVEKNENLYFKIFSVSL